MLRSGAPSTLPDAARFDLLLPLRGVLALAVVLHHISRVDMGLQYARVALFFVISGYCIFASAESVRVRAEPVRDWIARRVLRIWPTYLLTFLVLAIVLAIRDRPYRVLHPDQSPLIWIANLFLIPWVRLTGQPFPVAWQNPDLIIPMHWTLGYEVQFYALVAIVLSLASGGRHRLAALACALGLSGLATNVLSPNADHGLITDYGLCFALGAAVYYRATLAQPAARRIIDLAIAAFFLSALAATLRLSPPTPASRNAPAEIAVASAFAGLLILLRPRSIPLARARWLAPLRLLGVMSYSLFLIHPINFPFARALAHATLPADPPRWLYISLQLLWHILLAIPFWWLCERPFTRLMKRRAANHPVAPPSGRVPIAPAQAIPESSST